MIVQLNANGRMCRFQNNRLDKPWGGTLDTSVLSTESALLSGRAVVVTGSGKGLGRLYAIAAALHGASVIVNDVDIEAAENVADEVKDAGARVELLNGDVASWTVAEALINKCVDTFGRIDCLINNAGVFHTADPWLDTEADIRREVDNNLLGTFFPGTHAIARMHEQGSGVILNTSSGNGQAGKRDGAAYAATKAAVSAVTYSWALALRSHGVRVNAVCPTGDTPMVESTETRTVTWPADWAAALAIYLISDLSAPITGQVIRLWDRELSVMTQPKLALPIQNQESPWTVREIATAFNGDMKKALSPIGLGNVEPAVVTH
jgi:NAD(P)-dependent dehydrogenase (short-subunit alcohol dehydrogenase family)